MAEKWQKRVLKSPITHAVLSRLAATVMRFVYYSCRRQRFFPESVKPYERGDGNAIFIFWHGRMIMMPFLKPRKKVEFAVLISHHNDGALITSCIERFGINAVRGSKSKGSSEAVRGLVEAAGRGASIGITPDGPRGPFQVAAPGAIYVAMRTGQPIIPVGYSATRHWRLRSWDKFMIPKPFSRIAFVAGEPFTVKPEMGEAELAIALNDLNTRLDAVTAEADHRCGVAA